jgi:DivIVA domain-containing protein
MPNSGDEETRWPHLALIREVRFRLGLKGYNVAEVDQFLDVLTREVGELRSALEAAETEVDRLRAQIWFVGDYEGVPHQSPERQV